MAAATPSPHPTVRPTQRNRRPGSLLFPHHALLRDEFRKIRLDELHLLDRQRLSFGERTNARCFSGVVTHQTSATGVRRDKSALFQWVHAPPGETLQPDTRVPRDVHESPKVLPSSIRCG